MARANRTGVPGLSLITTGPHAGRYRLGFRYVCPVTRKPARLSKLYSRDLDTDAIKADARALVNDALTGAVAKRLEDTKTEAANSRGGRKAVLVESLRSIALELGSADALLDVVALAIQNVDESS